MRRRHRAAGRRRRTSRRCSGGCSPRETPESCRRSSRPPARRGRGARAMPSRSPPYSWTGVRGSVPSNATCVVPACWYRPGRGRVTGRRRCRSREPVREDLVDDAVAAPVGGGRVDAEPEVERVRSVVLGHAGGGQPALPAAVEQEPVMRDRVVHRQPAAPPDRALVAVFHGARVVDRLRVVRRPDPDRLHGVGGIGAQPDLDLAVERGLLVGQVERRAVVVRLVQQVIGHGSSRTAPGPAAASSSPGFINAQLFRLRQPQPMQPSRRVASSSIRRICSSSRGRQAWD